MSLLLGLFAASGCRSGILRSAVAPPSPHERYAASLRDAGLETAALGREWLAAARAALEKPVPRTLPFQETGYFGAERPEAVAYRFRLTRGQRLVAEVQWQATESGRLFVDLFFEGAVGEAPRRVYSAEEDIPRLEYEAESSGDFLLRFQPELLRGGRYTVVQRAVASLAFPVKDRGPRAIGGAFGDPRDGGRRNHEGIDIFAPRGTPAVAPAEATVQSVGTNPLGGNVVWLWDSRRDFTYYYAHLDEQTVRSGQRVLPGETVGLVGDSGNARGGSPHLHFAIYRRGEGALDPRPFVATPPGEIAPLTADASAVGTRRRVAAGSLSLGSAPSARTPVLERLSRHTLLRIAGATESWYRVFLPDGRTGYVAAKGTESAASPVRRVRRESASDVVDHPLPRAAVVERVAAGVDLPVFGHYGEFLFVRTPADRAGWLETAN